MFHPFLFKMEARISRSCHRMLAFGDSPGRTSYNFILFNYHETCGPLKGKAADFYKSHVTPCFIFQQTESLLLCDAANSRTSVTLAP